MISLTFLNLKVHWSVCYKSRRGSTIEWPLLSLIVSLYQSIIIVLLQTLNELFAFILFNVNCYYYNQLLNIVYFMSNHSSIIIYILDNSSTSIYINRFIAFKTSDMNTQSVLINESIHIPRCWHVNLLSLSVDYVVRRP